MQVYIMRTGGDEQYTPKYGVEILLPYIQHLRDKTIWCPFDEKESWFVKVFEENGFKVVYSHISLNQNFFEYEPFHWDVLISNPPYKDKRSIFEKVVSFNKPFALLVPLTTLNDTIIHVVMKGKQLQLLVPEKRIRFYDAETKQERNRPTFKATYFGWNIFEKDLILANFLNKQLYLH